MYKNYVQSCEANILLEGLVSRAVFFAAIIVFDLVFDDYDSSASLGEFGALRSCEIVLESSSQYVRGGEVRTPTRLEGLAVWDSAFFVRIAQCGYEFEQSQAFFPGLPFLCWVLTRTLLSPFLAFAGERGTLVLSGLLITNSSFILAALLLYRLSRRVLGSERLARASASAFCWNPASVFFSAVYTESPYAAAAFGGMLALESGRLAASAAAFAASAALRSNGVVNAGFVLHRGARGASRKLAEGEWAGAAGAALAAALGAAAVTAPFAAFQWFGYRRFCLGAAPGERPGWCEAAPPRPYSHVQKEYWGVGFLSYFEPKQAPNFLLAAPILTASTCGIWLYLSADWRRALWLGLGRREAAPRPPKPARGYLSDGVLVYVFHWGFLALAAVLFMHVQVATRFLSACPPLYWYAAHLWNEGKRRKLMLAFSLTYGLAGAVLHANFYPWT